MKVSLIVSQGVHQGKVIPVSLTQFLIGRDPQCQLRPASAAISKRHCAILTRGEEVFIRDFDSTNGTFLNEERIQGEVAIKQGDSVKVGPLHFTVAIEVTVAAKQPVAAAAPVGVSEGPGVADDSPRETEEDIAAMILGLKEGDAPPSTNSGEDSIPGGTTVLEVPAVNPDQANPTDKKKANSANTSTAAEAILKKYMRRPRA